MNGLQRRLVPGATAVSAVRATSARLIQPWHAGTLLAFGAMALFSAGLAVAADWPQLLGPTRNGVSPEAGLAPTWPREGPPKVWDRQVGLGFSGPVVAGNRLILFHRLGDQEVVECLEADTGKALWRFDYPTRYVDDFRFDEGPRATPLIAGDRVYTLGAEGRLTCLELATGKKVWQRALQDDYRAGKGFFGIGTSPILEGDKVLVNIGGPGAGIVAVDRDTGQERWKVLDHEASYSSPTAATIDGVRHALFFTREGIVSVDPADGKVRFSKPWRARLNASVNAATPLVIGDLLFVSAEYSVGAVVLRVRKDGFDEVWKSTSSLSNHYNTSVHHDGFLYGIDGRQEGGAARLRCVELQTGKVRWTQDRFGCASMILADGHLIALNEQGELLLIEPTPEAYREKARAAVLTFPCRAEIALAGGRLYARDTKRLICLDLKKAARK
jgi:outer membrane protein assembly factor BamB